MLLIILQITGQLVEPALCPEEPNFNVLLSLFRHKTHFCLDESCLTVQLAVKWSPAQYMQVGFRLFFFDGHS